MIFCIIPRAFKDITLDHETVMSLDPCCISPYQASFPGIEKCALICFLFLTNIILKSNTNLLRHLLPRVIETL